MKVGLSLAAVLAVGCGSSRSFAPPTADSIIVFPPPPDTVRIQYLTSISGDQDLGGGPSGFMGMFSDWIPKTIAKPYGVHAASGRIYVCDLDRGAVDIVNLEDRSLSYFTPKGLGSLGTPLDVESDSTRSLFVVDRNRGQVIEYDSSLSFVGAFGSPRTMVPTALGLDADRVYVSDVQNNVIRVFSRETRTELFSFPGPDADSLSALGGPVAVEVAGGLVYVTSTFARRVTVFTTDGEFVRTIGRPGRNLGMFDRPKGVAVDRDGITYVVDSGYAVVQLFDRQGRVLMDMGRLPDGGSQLVLPVAVELDYYNQEFFRPFVYEGFSPLYLIYVANQFGDRKIQVYARVEDESSPSP